MADSATHSSEAGPRREQGTPVQAVDRALHILELLADDGPSTVVTLAEALGVHRTTAFRLLATLEHRRFVQHRADGSYALGSGALRVGGAATVRSELARDAQEICEEVTAETGETSNVAVLADGGAVNIAQATGTSSVSVRNQFTGQRTPLHATSSGKVLLAHADQAVIADVAARLTRFSESTIVTAAALQAELTAVRECGWGAALAEWQEDTNAVAVPVFASDGTVVAALSLTAPDFRLPSEQIPDVAHRLRQHADELAKRLGYLKPRRRA